MSTLYQEDFYSWSRAQAAGLRRLAELRLNDLPELDWRELAEEIEDLGRSLERELHSRYVVLLLHLLKWQFQPGYRCGSWQSSITNQRRAIARLLRKNPGLKAKIADEFADAYEPARLRAMSETGFALATFPKRCPFARELVEDEAFWPGGEPDL
ncbi:MAG TPA: DUF29 domain-containing protein [Geminicoccaceae bacterium]|nr:DUF29 domain-containing protein [Geminicoccaceae bacterium]